MGREKPGTEHGRVPESDRTPPERRGPLSIDGLPTLAELDAVDMAALGRSGDGQNTPTPGKSGPPPGSLRAAVAAWWAAAVCAVIAIAYSFTMLSDITDMLRRRLEDGVAHDPANAAPANHVDSLASAVPPVLLILAILFVAASYPLLAAIGSHHSRNCRNFYATLVVVILVCIPIGIDLLLGYRQISGAIRVCCWAQFALLALSVLLVFRRSVNHWLPDGPRVRPR